MPVPARVLLTGKHGIKSGQKVHESLVREEGMLGVQRAGVELYKVRQQEALLDSVAGQNDPSVLEAAVRGHKMSRMLRMMQHEIGMTRGRRQLDVQDREFRQRLQSDRNEYYQGLAEREAQAAQRFQAYIEQQRVATQEGARPVGVQPAASAGDTGSGLSPYQQNLLNIRVGIVERSTAGDAVAVNELLNNPDTGPWLVATEAVSAMKAANPEMSESWLTDPEMRTNLRSFWARLNQQFPGRVPKTIDEVLREGGALNPSVASLSR